MDQSTLSLVKKAVVTTTTQTAFMEAIFSEKYTRLLFGGGVGGGKTTGGILALCALCKIFPGSRWGIVRQDRPTLRRNTLPSFWKTAPQPFFHPDRYNKQDMIATAINGSRIEFVPESIQEDPDLKKFDGYEMNGFFLEEADELQVATYLKCIERSARWLIDPMPLPYILLSCNPHQGFLKDVFYTPWEKKTLKPPYYFIKSLVTDNPHHSPEYLKNLQEIKLRAPALFRRLVEGSWDAEDNAKQLISWNSLYDSKEKFYFEDDVKDPDYVETQLSLGGDIGRYGPDPTVLTLLEGNYDIGFNIIKQEAVDQTSIPEVYRMVREWIDTFNIQHDRVCIDTVGLGGGVHDMLGEAGYYVQSIVGGGKVLEQNTEGGFKFANFKAQLGWNVKIIIEDHKLGGLIDEELRSDLGAQGYDTIGDRYIKLWDKETIKKKLHRSTDKGDSTMYGIWGQIHDHIFGLPGFEIL